MEPQAVNTLVKESEALKQRVLEEFSGEPPSLLLHLFGEANIFFQEEVLGQWRSDERFDELIDYLLYQYSDQGGEELWKQVLLDLRLKNDLDRATRLLEGLLKGRVELHKVAFKNSNKFPGNYLSSANLAVTRGEAMKLLYEYAFLLENQPAESRDETKIKKVKSQITKILKE